MPYMLASCKMGMLQLQQQGYKGIYGLVWASPCTFMMLMQPCCRLPAIAVASLCERFCFGQGLAYS